MIAEIGECAMHRIATRSSSGPAFGKAGRRVPPGAFRGERAFLAAVLRTMSSIGDCRAPVRPLRYPRDAKHRDLTRIGGDMYKAMGWHAAERKRDEKEQGEESPDSASGPPP